MVSSRPLFFSPSLSSIFPSVPYHRGHIQSRHCGGTLSPLAANQLGSARTHARTHTHTHTHMTVGKEIWPQRHMHTYVHTMQKNIHLHTPKHDCIWPHTHTHTHTHTQTAITTSNYQTVDLFGYFQMGNLCGYFGRLSINYVFFFFFPFGFQCRFFLSPSGLKYLVKHTQTSDFVPLCYGPVLIRDVSGTSQLSGRDFKNMCVFYTINIII